MYSLSRTVQLHRLIRPVLQVTDSRMSAIPPEAVGMVKPDDVPYVVGHDQKNQKFYISLKDQEDADQAVLEYQWVKKGVVDLYHTGVPPSFRGKGIAKVLAKAAFDYVVETDSKMRLSCTYLQKYLKDNQLPEYTSRAVPLD